MPENIDIWIADNPSKVISYSVYYVKPPSANANRYVHESKLQAANDRIKELESDLDLALEQM
jgi:hypothetical protein